jgi:hypothetical protein
MEYHLVMYKYNARCLDRRKCLRRESVVKSLSIGIEYSSYSANMCLDRLNDLVSIKHW